MTATSQYSIYDGRQFMGSLGQDATGAWRVRDQNYKPIGEFNSKVAAIAAITARYMPPREARHG